MEISKRSPHRHLDDLVVVEMEFVHTYLISHTPALLVGGIEESVGESNRMGWAPDFDFRRRRGGLADLDQTLAVPLSRSDQKRQSVQYLLAW